MLAETSFRRKRISHACKPCGERKVKCDGVSPTCGRCLADNITCFYGVSKRNKRAPPPATSVVQPLFASPIDHSNSSLQSQPTIIVDRVSVRNIKDGPASEPEGTKVPDHVLSRLLQTYFRYIHPIWPLLYKPLYSSLDSTQLLDVLPQPLVDAISAIAVLLEDSQDFNPSPSKHEQAQNFFTHALMALEKQEAGRKSRSIFAAKPSILQCQVFTILALQQHSIAAYSQAGTLCGVAATMAIELQIHRKLDTDNYMDIEIKSRLWWSVYVLEKMLSCEMGRPTILRAEEADAPFPSVDESDEFEFFSGFSQAGTVSEQTKFPPSKLRTLSAFRTSIRLAMIMENVSRQIYGVRSRQRIRENRQIGEETRLRLWAELQEWERSMEVSPLKLDTSENLSSPPVVVTNYVYMWSTTILLHRPFIEHWQHNGSNAGSPTSQSLQADPYEVCLFSADQICSTLEKYSGYSGGLPCDLVFPIFVAANILLRRWREAASQRNVLRPRLELCIQWLNALGKSWKSAEARGRILLESINDAQTSEVGKEVSDSPWEGNSSEAEIALNDPSNFTLLNVQDDFDFQYMEWITAQGTEWPSE